jgi:hypothetical protein
MSFSVKIGKCYALIYCNDGNTFKFVIIASYLNQTGILLEQEHCGSDLIYPFFEIMNGNEEVLKFILNDENNPLYSFAKAKEKYNNIIQVRYYPDYNGQDVAGICEQLPCIEDIENNTAPLSSTADIFSYILEF